MSEPFALNEPHTHTWVELGRYEWCLGCGALRLPSEEGLC